LKKIFMLCFIKKATSITLIHMDKIRCLDQLKQTDTKKAS
jgi:hypothetical protein